MAISPQVLRMLEWIRNSTDAASLAQLKENLAPSAPLKAGLKTSAILGKYTPEEREALLKAIEARLLEIASSASKSRDPAGAGKARRGPAKDREAREFLDELGSLIEREFDLSGNKLKTNKIKTGGDKVRGDRFVDLYLAFKDENGVSVKLFWRQDKSDEAAYLEFNKTQTGGPKAGDLREPVIFRLDQKDEAAELYRSELAKLAPWRGDGA